MDIYVHRPLTAGVFPSRPSGAQPAPEGPRRPHRAPVYPSAASTSAARFALTALSPPSR